MYIRLMGKKRGTTRIFDETGSSTPVTVIELQPNFISQVKTLEGEGYTALQLSVGSKKRSRINKAEAGHFAKAGVEAAEKLFEVAIPNDQVDKYKVGESLSVQSFEKIKKVDVTAFSKGKGFQGAVKRHNFKTQDHSHGNSRAHRKPGSIGQNQDPGKVFKGKKMAGRMGNVKTTVQSLTVVKVDLENNLLLVKGAVPGYSDQWVTVKAAEKCKHIDN